MNTVKVHLGFLKRIIFENAQKHVDVCRNITTVQVATGRSAMVG